MQFIKETWLKIRNLKGSSKGIVGRAILVDTKCLCSYRTSPWTSVVTKKNQWVHRGCTHGSFLWVVPTGCSRRCHLQELPMGATHESIPWVLHPPAPSAEYTRGVAYLSTSVMQICYEDLVRILRERISLISVFCHRIWLRSYLSSYPQYIKKRVVQRKGDFFFQKKTEFPGRRNSQRGEFQTKRNMVTGKFQEKSSLAFSKEINRRNIRIINRVQK